MINWKPMSQFEKTNSNQCLIVDNGKLLHVEYDANLGVLMAEMSMYKDGRMKAYKSFHLHDLTHFADVPNLHGNMLKFEQESENITAVRTNELRIGTIFHIEKNIYQADGADWFFNSCQNTQGIKQDMLYGSLEDAKEKFSADWDIWLDKAGLQVKGEN